MRRNVLTTAVTVLATVSLNAASAAQQPGWFSHGHLSADADSLTAAVADLQDDGLAPSAYVNATLRALIDTVRAMASAPLPAQIALEAALTDAFERAAHDLADGRVDPASVDTMWNAVPHRLDVERALGVALREHRVGAVLRGFAPPNPDYVRLRGQLRALRAESAANAAPDTAREALAGQLAVNMERLRWLPRTAPPLLVVVNIPDATLTVMDRGVASLTTRVVAGALDWPTPMTTARITGIVLNPTWEVPPAIVRAEMLPAARADPSALARLGIGVWQTRDDSLVPIDPDSIDWTALGDSAATRYRFRQPPGAGNPLGRIKFTVPNRFGVALHDTPSRNLFAAKARYFSHGCVRVESPERIADIVLRGDTAWSPDSLNAALAEGVERQIALPASVPIYFVYQTVWVDPKGRLHRRPDVYGWDRELREALAR